MEIKQREWNVDMVDKFAQFFFDFKLHPYQKRFIAACLKYNRIAGKWPRQSGKSTTVGVYTLFKALTDDVSIIIVAPTQSQSGELFKKIRDMAVSNPAINSQIVKSTQTELVFATHSRILSLPSGNEGTTIRGYKADIAIIEEAGFMKDQIVNTVIIPMIASKKEKGKVIKIGTPWTRNNFYRSCYEDEEYTVISINWEEVVKEGQYDMKFINEQKSQLLDIEFETEYGAEFIDDAYAFFPISILENCKETYPLFPKY